MFSKNFYLAVFFICFVLGTVTKVMRYQYDQAWLDAVLGCAPSFFYLFGMLAVPGFVFKNLTFFNYLKCSVCVTIGAFIYEFEQLTTTRTFDSADVLALIVAFFLVTGVHWIKQKGQVDRENRPDRV